MSSGRRPSRPAEIATAALSGWLALARGGWDDLLARLGPTGLGAIALLAVLLASPWPPLSLLALAGYAVLTWRRPGLTVALLPLAMPFAYQPKGIYVPRFQAAEPQVRLIELHFPVVELLLLLALATTALHLVLRWWGARRAGEGAAYLLDAWDAARAAVRAPFGLHAAALGLVASFSLLTVADPGHLREGLREYRTVVVEPLLYFFLARAWLRDRELRAIAVVAFLAGATVVAALAIGQVLTGVGVVVAEGARRATGVYRHPNNLALYLERALPFALALLLLGPEPPGAWWRTRRYPVPLLAVVPILGLGLLFTFSRGAFAGVAVALLALALVSGRREVRLGLLGVLLVGGVLLGALASGRLASLAGGGGSLGLRQLIWRSTLAMLRDHPAFGVGLDQFLYQYAPRYVDPAAWGERFTAHPHNLFLDFWVRLGIMGLAWLGWLLVVVGDRFARGWARLADGQERALVVATGVAALAALVHGLLDNFYFLIDLAFVWWFLLALLQVATETGEARAAPEPVERRAAARARPARTARRAKADRAAVPAGTGRRKGR